MSKLLIEDREIVVPGQVVAEGMEYLPSYGTYRAGDNILANRVGVVSLDGKVIKTIPLSGKYIARRNDVIIGKIFDIMTSGWRVNVNGAHAAMIPVKDGTFEFIPRGADLTRYFRIDDYIVCKVTNITSQNLIDLTAKGQGLHKLRGGRIVYINTHKVPRIIGKKGSMVSMIKQATGCKIVVGQNGLVWLSGEDPKLENIAVQAIEKIDKESHISGLTDRIKIFLEDLTGNKIENNREKVDDEIKAVNFEDSQENLSFEDHQKED